MHTHTTMPIAKSEGLKGRPRIEGREGRNKKEIQRSSGGAWEVEERVTCECAHKRKKSTRQTKDGV